MRRLGLGHAWCVGLLCVAMAACPSKDNDTDDADADTDADADSDTDTDTDSDTDLEVNCENADAILGQLAMVQANEAYQLCLDEDPDDPEANFGWGFSRLFLVPEWDPVQEAFELCDEDNEIGDNIYGLDGIGVWMSDHVAGEADLTVEWDPSSGSGETLADAFDEVYVVMSMEDEDYLRVEVAETLTWDVYLDLEIELSEIEEGVVLDVSELPEWAVSLGLNCSQPGSSCDGWNKNDHLSGEITFDTYSTGDGAELELSLDVTIGAWCDEEENCNDVHHVSGTVTDTVQAEPDVESWIPFYDVEDYVCDEKWCDEFIILATLDDLCDGVTQIDQLNGLMSDISDEFENISDAFSNAAEDQGLSFAIPGDNIFLTNDDVYVNQVDANALAGLTAAAAFSLEFVAQYDLLKPDAAPEDLLSDYTVDEETWNDSGDTGITCEEEEYWGMDRPEAISQINSYFGSEANGASWSDAEADMQAVFDSALAILNGDPNGDGFLDFSGEQQKYVDYRDAVGGDLEAVLDAFANGSAPLPSSEAIIVNIGDFFADPLTLEKFYDDQDISALVFLDSDTCYEYISWDDEDALLWLAQEGGGALHLPDSVFDDEQSCDGNGDCLDGEFCNDWDECEVYTPALFDEDLFESIINNDDVPYFIDEDRFDVFEPLIGD